MNARSPKPTAQSQPLYDDCDELVVDGPTTFPVDRRDFMKLTGTGLLVLVGIGREDDEAAGRWLAEKLLKLRVFEDGEGRLNRTVSDAGGGILVVSQFTLYGDCRKGRRPSFASAEDPGPAKALYEYFVSMAQGKAGGAQAGEFQAMMKIDSVNDGPVTIIIDTKRQQ